MSVKGSSFATLWIDQEDPSVRLAEIRAMHGQEVAEKIEGFINNGFLILNSIISKNEISKYEDALKNLLENNSDVKISLGTDIKTNSELDIGTPLTKILDTHAILKESVPLFFNSELFKYLTLIFGEEPLAFQSLYFNVGSTQAIHQDTAYVVVDQPLNLAASWIALEDVSEGAGELQYIPGSHRFPDYLYGQHFRHWSAARDGEAIHDHHLHWLRKYAEENGHQLVKFRPKQGDVLIWHADLAHGGAEITTDATRKSLVTHYCGAKCTPHYFQYMDVPQQNKVKTKGGYISSFYYNLKARKAKQE